MNEKLAYWSIPKELVIVECKDCEYSDIVINSEGHIQLQCTKKIIDNPTLFDYCSYGEKKR